MRQQSPAPPSTKSTVSTKSTGIALSTGSEQGARPTNRTALWDEWSAGADARNTKTKNRPDLSRNGYAIGAAKTRAVRHFPRRRKPESPPGRRNGKDAAYFFFAFAAIAAWTFSFWRSRYAFRRRRLMTLFNC